MRTTKSGAYMIAFYNSKVAVVKLPFPLLLLDLQKLRAAANLAEILGNCLHVRKLNTPQFLWVIH